MVVECIYLIVWQLALTTTDMPGLPYQYFLSGDFHHELGLTTIDHLS